MTDDFYEDDTAQLGVVAELTDEQVRRVLCGGEATLAERLAVRSIVLKLAGEPLNSPRSEGT